MGRNNENEKYEFKQIISIVYNDNAPMYSYGGIIVKQSEILKFEEGKFEKMEYIVNSDDHIELKVPELTLKEVNLLNSLVHLKKEEIDIELKKYSIPLAEFEAYKKIYRYFPHFSEINIG